MRDFIDTATLSCLFIFLGIDYVRSMLLQEQEEGKEKKEREKGREIEISERQENEPPEKTEGERGGSWGRMRGAFAPHLHWEIGSSSRLPSALHRLIFIPLD